jgi:hypothetical protein
LPTFCCSFLLVILERSEESRFGQWRLIFRKGQKWRYPAEVL